MMKTVPVVLKEIKLGSPAGSTDGWLIVTTDPDDGSELVHGVVHQINGEDYTLSSTTDERIQGFGWAPLFDSLSDLKGDVEIALALQSGAEVQEWLEESERHDH